MDDLHPSDDHSHKFFIWPEWIAANGPLTAQSAFEYFTTSMFYDKQSNNQVLRMQTLHTGLPVTNEAEELMRFTGIEFALVHAQPPSLFIIHKRERLSPDQVRPLTAYFIVNNRIYQSPDVYSVLSNRLLTAVNSLQISLSTLRRYRPDFAPRTGFVWPIVEDPDQDAPPASKTRASSIMPGIATDIPDPQPAAPRKKQENYNLMLNAMRTTATHSRQVFTDKVEDPPLEPEETSATRLSPSALTRNNTNTSQPSTTTPNTPGGADSTNRRRKKSI